MATKFRSIVLGALLAAISATGSAFGQSDDEPTTLVESSAPSECWENYSECSAAAFGDEGWRSGCYADFTSCLGRQELGLCPQQGVPSACTDYQTQCKEFAIGNEEAEKQCSSDVDVCKYAHGC